MWWLGLILVVELIAVFYFFLGRGIKSSITQELLKRQLVLARAGAANVTSFFQAFGDSMSVLSQLSSIEGRGAQTGQDMDTFVHEWQSRGLIGGTVLTDEQGMVLFNSNILQTPDLGASLADRDYFVWAKAQQGEERFFVGQPVRSRLGASKGEVIVPVASPVFQNGVFAGVVASSVQLEPLIMRYLGLMKATDLTDVYLTDELGNLFYSRNPLDATGQNVYDLLQLKVTFDTDQEGQLQTDEFLVAHVPVTLDNQNWILVATTPIDYVLERVTPVYIQQTAIIILVSLTILTFSMVTSRRGPDTNPPQKAL